MVFWPSKKYLTYQPSQADKEKELGNKKSIGPCYDYRSGKYLTFEEWLNRFLKEWNKIN